MDENMFRFSDDLGPDKIIHFTKPSVGLKGILVVDNVAAGPAIGGTRMASDVSVEECVRLARAMTFKNAAAGLPHGGAKAVIFGDPAMPAEEKEQMVRAYACAIREIIDFIPGPDMGTDETAMAWVRDEIGRSVGLPREVGGIPLDEIGATGFGLAVAAEVAQDFCDITLEGARMAIQGFGAVGKHAARFLAERGAVLVGASDSRGTIANPDGIDVAELITHKEAGNPVADYSKGKQAGPDEIISVSCDIWIPAARPDVLWEDNVDQLDCKMVLQGANIPATLEAEAKLHERGILCVPDFIANAGGVICASVEYHGGTQSGALGSIEEKLRFNTRQVLQAARDEKLKPREAAVRLAEKRVRRAMALSRWG
jgi:glutamate dehydrogenase (NAD(P)+)